MADERDRWLDRAAADRLLRGEPVAPGAEQHARTRSERLRAALDALAEPPPAAAAGLPGELRGEAAAVAAFRAARGSLLAAEPQTRSPDPELFGSADTVVELGPPAGGPAPASRSRRGRPVRFALAAAVASVAVGGLAAAAGTGLLDRDTRDTAGRVPAVSVTSGALSAGQEGGAKARPLSSPGTTAPPGAERPSGTPQPGNTPGADGRTTTGPGGGATAASGGSGTEPTANGSAGDKDGRDRSLQGGTDGTTSGTGERDRGRDRDRDREGRTGAVQLCRDHRAGRLDEEGRERLVRLAKGLLRVPRYCQTVLGLTAGGGSRADAPNSPPAQNSPQAPGSPARSLELAPVRTLPPAFPEAFPEAGERR